MEEKKQRPDRLEPIQGEVSLKSKSEDSDYLYNNQDIQSNSTKKLCNIMNGMDLFAELKRRKEAGK